MRIDSITGTEQNRTTPSLKTSKKYFAHNFSDTIKVKRAISETAIQIRKLKISRNWTDQQRAQRRRVGIANRAWLLNVIQKIKTN